MTDIYIGNATPNSNALGIKDLSGRVQRNAPVIRPMHLPFFAFYGQKGTTEDTLVDGTSFTNIYGTDTLDENSPYFNHASAFIKRALNDGGAIIAKRIVPEDAMELASLRLSVDYLEVEVDEIERGTDGSFVKQVNGEYKKTGSKVPGVQYKFVVSKVPSTTSRILEQDVKVWEFGKGTQTVGDQTDSGGSGGTSKRIPLFDFAVASPGAHGNLSGVSIWSPSLSDLNPINRIALADTRSYPFRISLRVKDTPTSSPRTALSIRGARELDFVLKPRAISKAGVQYHIGSTFVKEYNILTPENPLTPPTYGPFSRIHVYQENIDAFTKLCLGKELAQAKEIASDFTGLKATDAEGDAKYLFNIFGGHHSDGRPYQTYRKGALGDDGVHMGETITLWASGGKDGEMNDTAFAKAVENILEEFADRNSKYQDDTRFNDSMFYDSGFPLDTKKKLGKYMGSRHDRFVVATTHIAGEDYDIPVAEENARLAMINGFLRQYPESIIFGTGTCRAITCKGSIELMSSVSGYPHRLPATYELLGMFGKWNGAASGNQLSRWDITEGDNNYLRYTAAISNSWTPYHVRNEAWDAGGMWASRSQSGRFYFEAIRTIFADESSTLMTPRIVFVHMELNKINRELHRMFSGKDWPELRLKQEMEDEFYRRISNGKFANKVDIQFEVTLTDIDREKGYAYHTKAMVFGDGIKTVNTFYSENYRSSDKPDSFNGIRA